MTHQKNGSEDKIERDSFFNDLMMAYNELGEWARGEKAARVTQLVQAETITRDETGPEFAQHQGTEAETFATLSDDVPLRQYTVLYTNTEEGWEANIPDLPGCETVGDSLEEAQNLIRYFINKHVQALRAAGEAVPEPRTCAEQIDVAA